LDFQAPFARLYCENCPKKTVGRFFKKSICPECRIEMVEVSTHAPPIRNRTAVRL